MNQSLAQATAAALSSDPAGISEGSKILAAVAPRFEILKFLTQNSSMIRVGEFGSIYAQSQFTDAQKNELFQMVLKKDVADFTGAILKTEYNRDHDAAQAMIKAAQLAGPQSRLRAIMLFGVASADLPQVRMEALKQGDSESFVVMVQQYPPSQTEARQLLDAAKKVTNDAPFAANSEGADTSMSRISQSLHSAAGINPQRGFFHRLGAKLGLSP